MSSSNLSASASSIGGGTDVDQEGINDILQSVNNFRQRHQNPSSTDSISLSEISSSLHAENHDNRQERNQDSDDDDYEKDVIESSSTQDPQRLRNNNSDIYVDPVRDLDISPILRFLCGWAPCCCCLYKQPRNDSTVGSSAYETIDSIAYDTLDSGYATDNNDPNAEFNPYPVNKNALGFLVLNLFYHLASAIWTGTVFSIYLYQILPNAKNAGVGIVEGIKIVSRLLVTIFFHSQQKDKDTDEEGSVFQWTRPTMMKIGGVITIVAAISQTVFLAFISQNYPTETTDDFIQRDDYIQGFSSLFEKDEYYLILQGFSILSMLWGIQSGIILNRNGPTVSLFRDSIYEQLKRDYLTFYHILAVLSSTVGTLLSIFLFILLRARDWNINDLANIMYVGMGIEIFAGFTMFLPKSIWTNGEDEVIPPPTPVQTMVHNPYETADMIRKRRRWVPRILFAHYVLFNTGSGMILPFFPLFFDIQCHLSPMSIQSIFMFLPILNEIFSQFLYNVYTKFQLSDMETFVFAKAEGVIFLYLIILTQFFDFFDKEPFWIACMFILRTVCVNSSSYVEEKIYTEATSLTVPATDANFMSPNKKQKAWSTRFEAVKIISYSIGAVVGGIFVDTFGGRYGPMFLIAAVSQSLALLILGYMFQFVPNQIRREMPIARPMVDEESEDEIYTHHDESIEQLLL